MKLRLLTSAGLLLVAAPHLFAAGPSDGNRPDFDHRDWVTQQGLIPRQPVSKLPHVSRFDPEARLYVKFVDWARVRSNGGGMPQSGVGGDTSEVRDVLAEHNMRLTPMFEQDETVLQSVTDRAMLLSNKEQPDLAGMMYVEGPDADLEDAGNALNELDIVEFVRFEPRWATQEALGTTNANFNAEALDAAAPTQNYRPLQGWLDFFEDVNGDDWFDPDGEDDIFPSPDDEPFIGGVDAIALWNTGQTLLDEHLEDSAWDRRKNGGRGATINVGVVEFSIYPLHEDLRVIVEPGQTLLPPELVGFPNVNHGTATTGQIGAKDQGLPGPDRRTRNDNRELGVIGVVPEAKMWFFPMATADGAGRLPSAIIAMLNIFDPGDVANFSIGSPQGPIVIDAGTAILLQIATDLGIATVASAGNNCLNHDDIVTWPETDPGTVIVGAGHPTICVFPPYGRRGFSNHMTDERDRVNIQAWGNDVVTTGYGDLRGGQNPNRWYTDTFGGTSSAAPMITGVIAAMQGLSKMFYGIPVSVTFMKDTLLGSEQQWPQEGEPDPTNVSGTMEEPPCNPCVELCLSKEEDHQLVGGFPRLMDYFFTTAIDSVIESLFVRNPFGNSFAVYLEVLLGTSLAGNLNSIKAADGAWLIVASEHTDGGQGSAQNFPPPVWSFTGHGTDVGVAFDSIVPDDITQMGFAVIAAATNDSSMLGIELYNWSARRWDNFSASQLPGNGGFGGVTSVVAQHQNYINHNSRLAHIRAWIFGMGFGGNNFESAYELINLDFSQGGFGGGGGGGGGV